MPTELLTNGLIALVGGALGFLLSWLLEERKQQHELRRSVASVRVKAYRSLWPLCTSLIRDEQRMQRADALLVWYERGGGLFLSLAAMNRLMTALRLLRAAEFGAPQRAEVEHHLSWQRTEMKFHIGSYTRGEARTRLRSAPVRGTEDTWFGWRDLLAQTSAGLPPVDR